MLSLIIRVMAHDMPSKSFNPLPGYTALFHNDMEKFHEAYVGKWDSEEDFAYHIIEECYDLEKMMGGLSRFFNYEAYARELFESDYFMGDNGHVFRQC